MGILREEKYINHITVEDHLNWQWIQGGTGTMVAGIHVYIRVCLLFTEVMSDSL